MDGLVLDVVRLAVHDGPGIRTTVFLKGCPLQCRWCHNPESVLPDPEIGFTPGKCLQCGRCAEVCPEGVHSLNGGDHRLQRELCKACGACMEECLPGALRLLGQTMSAPEVVTAVLADRTFYAKSGGGCTLSGGEPLWQPLFCAEIFQLLGEAGIHRALDTSGAVPWEAFATVLPHTDLFLYDVKHTDDQRHREQVGAPNGEILENLHRLSRCQVPIEIRLPLIPGFNTDEESVAALGRLLGTLPHIVGVKLLPYHLARSKYEMVGRSAPLPGVTPPDAATVERATAILHDHGLRVTAPVRPTEHCAGT